MEISEEKLTERCVEKSQDLVERDEFEIGEHIWSIEIYYIQVSFNFILDTINNKKTAGAINNWNKQT